MTTLISQPFAPPTSGRLTISLWLRGPDVPRQQLPLRLAVVGKHQGRDFLRFAQLGQAGSPALGPVWSPVVVQVNDLPLDGLSQLQLRFDLLGQGQVWLDDIQLCQLAFSKSEVIEIFKLIAPANVKLQQGEVGDCVDLLESYWSRFLLANVAPGATPLTRKTELARPSAAAPPQPPERSASLLDRLEKHVRQLDAVVAGTLRVPSALSGVRLGGRHTECACYYGGCELLQKAAATLPRAAAAQESSLPQIATGCVAARRAGVGRANALAVDNSGSRKRVGTSVGIPGGRLIP